MHLAKHYGLKDIGQLASSADKYKPKTKVAFIVSSDLAFNFAKLYVRYRNRGKSTGKKICVFKSESDAVCWIQNDI